MKQSPKQQEDRLRQDIAEFYRACERKDKKSIGEFREKWNSIPKEFKQESLGKEIVKEVGNKLSKNGERKANKEAKPTDAQEDKGHKGRGRKISRSSKRRP